MSFFGKNIRKIRSLKSLSQQAFAELFDLKRGTLGAYEEGRSEPKIETILKIANYFSIPVDDLLQSELTVNKLLKFKDNFDFEAETGSTEKFASIPCITQRNQEKYISLFDKESFVKQMPCLHLPINTEKNFRGFTVNNLEMSSNGNGLFPKDIVIGEFVPANIYKKLNNDILVLALIGQELILRKLIITKENAVFRADHPNIEDITSPLEEIKELWRIRYVFFNRIPEKSTGIEEKLLSLQEQVNHLQSKI